MPSAIGAPFRRREPTIGKVTARRIAERPSAREVANVPKAQPPHFADLGVSERTCRPLFPFEHLGISGEGMNRRRRAAGGRAGRTGRAPEPDPDPVGLADHGVAGFGAERRGDDARAQALQRQSFQGLDRLVCPQHLRQAPNVFAALAVVRRDDSELVRIVGLLTDEQARRFTALRKNTQLHEHLD
jgi:hypothetical protein